MADQQHLTEHNFSGGPRVEKKDPGLPTMIVFDLDGKSESRHGMAWHGMIN
jgi:hypothetical protein